MNLPNPTTAPAELPRKSAIGSIGVSFWLCYAANTSMMMAVSLLFRYADFVRFLGGTEWQLGLIVGLGMVGSLFMRIAQGVGIDTFGPRKVWIWSNIGFIVACLLHTLISADFYPLLFATLARTLLQTSVAGFFGASITYISGRAPLTRIAEVVGTLGTSGFVGMMAGSALGDWLMRGASMDDPHLDRMFFVAAGLATLALALATVATHGHTVRRKSRRVPVWWLLRRYHPGPLLLVGIATGFGLSLPTIFLRPFALELGVKDIALFFLIYPPMAFATRLFIRRWPEQYGIRPMIFVGLGSLVVSKLLFLLVSSAWHLAIPAVVLGVAHACLFPAMVAGGSAAFPIRYRGLATTLTLATFDLGQFIGFPTGGLVLTLARWAGWPPFPTMYVVVAVMLAGVGTAYAVASRPRPKRQRRLREPSAVDTMRLPATPGKPAPRAGKPRQPVAS